MWVFWAIERLADFIAKAFGSSEGGENQDDGLLDVSKPPEPKKVQKMDEASKEKLAENQRVTKMIRKGRLDHVLSSPQVDTKAQKYVEMGFVERIYTENRKERLAEEASRKNR